VCNAYRASFLRTTLTLLLCYALSSTHLNGDSHRYKLIGKWSDACPCTIPCPCWKKSRANARRCLNVQVFHVDEGYFEDRNLSGLTFVLVGIPSEDYDTPELYRGYASSPLTVDYIESLFATVFHLPLARGAKAVSSVAEQITNEGHSVDVPDLLSYRIGPGDGVEKPDADVGRYLYPWIRDARQWRVREVRYYSQGGDIIYSGTNALAGTFLIGSESNGSNRSH